MPFIAIGTPLREAGLVGADWEFCFGHSMFGMPIRQTQGHAELAARNMQVEFKRCECGCYHHMDGT